MPKRWLATSVWIAFVLIVGAAAHLALAACDLGLHPLFGLSYCRAQAASDPLARERERERDLLDRLHEAQLNLSRLPICLPETPRREPERRAENVVPTPPPAPAPPKPDDRLIIPRNVNDLNGCWQSVRGDLNMVSDDEEQRPLGTMRICYCLTGDGRGETRYIFQDGGRCIGPLKAQVSGDRLTMSHGRIGCTGKSNLEHVVPTDIVCSNKAADESATCDTHSHGRVPTNDTGEKYHRVSFEHCN